jgi:hypothetical protein
VDVDVVAALAGEAVDGVAVAEHVKRVAHQRHRLLRHVEHPARRRGRRHVGGVDPGEAVFDHLLLGRIRAVVLVDHR